MKVEVFLNIQEYLNLSQQLLIIFFSVLLDFLQAELF